MRVRVRGCVLQTTDAVHFLHVQVNVEHEPVRVHVRVRFRVCVRVRVHVCVRVRVRVWYRLSAVQA